MSRGRSGAFLDALLQAAQGDEARARLLAVLRRFNGERLCISVPAHADPARVAADVLNRCAQAGEAARILSERFGYSDRHARRLVHQVKAAQPADMTRHTMAGSGGTVSTHAAQPEPTSKRPTLRPGAS